MKTFRTRSTRRLVPLLLLGAAACDIPTEPPIVEQRWMVSMEDNRIGVDELLPPGVTVVDGAFEISVDSLTEDETLGSLCPDCVSGTNVVPEFSGVFTGVRALPEGVGSATVIDGTVEIQVANGFAFDPLAGGGTVAVRILDGEGGDEVGSLRLEGGTDVLAPNSTLATLLTLDGFTVGDELQLSVEVDSPGGQTATVDVDDIVSVHVITHSLRVSEAMVDVTGRTVSLETMSLDFDDVDEAILDRLGPGAVTFEIANPFGVSVDGTVDVGPTTRPFGIPTESSSSVSLSYTGDELRSILNDRGATFTGSGIAGGGVVTLTPDLEMIIDPTLDVVLTVG